VQTSNRKRKIKLQETLGWSNIEAGIARLSQPGDGTRRRNEEIGFMIRRRIDIKTVVQRESYY